LHFNIQSLYHDHHVTLFSPCLLIYHTPAKMKCLHVASLRAVFFYKLTVAIPRMQVFLFSVASLIFTGWRRLTGCQRLQVVSCKRATNYRALLRKMTCQDTASYGSSPPCIGVGVETSGSRALSKVRLGFSRGSTHATNLKNGATKDASEARQAVYTSCIAHYPATLSTREASWRRVFDPYAPLLFNLYYCLEQNLHFRLVPETQF